MTPTPYADVTANLGIGDAIKGLTDTVASSIAEVSPLILGAIVAVLAASLVFKLVKKFGSKVG